MRSAPSRSQTAAVAFALVTSALSAVAPSGASAAEFQPERRLRRPVGLVAVDEWLFVANGRSGTVSVVNPSRQTVVNEVAVGSRLSDLAAAGDGRYLLATDEEKHRLVLLERRGSELNAVRSLDVARFPVSVLVGADGKECTIASLWSRRLTFVELQVPRGGRDSGPGLSVSEVVDLPFAPRVQCLIGDGGRLVVADAFGGRFAVVDVRRQELVAVHSLPGHNIRGLAVSPDGRELLVSHQILNDEESTTEDNVFWGGVMLNVVRSIPLDELLAADRQKGPSDGTIHPLGQPGSATGDPADILVTAGKQTIVALAGVDELAVRFTPLEPYIRRKVGRRPTALTVAPDGRFAYVANSFGDSISVLDLQTRRVTGEISLGPPPELTLADRGERLFYDARLSLNGWFSCHSCHTDGHTNGRLNDNFGDDYFGEPKRILSLLGTRDTGPWAWNGGAQTLARQIEKSIKVTMQGGAPDDATVRALNEYLLTLRPPPSLAEARSTRDRDAIERGRTVFTRQGCASCHTPPTYTSPDVYDVGIHDKRGTTEFNPPSLRGLSQRGPYFHDNRAGRLEDVFTKHRHGLDGELSRKELDDLLAFLRDL